MHTEPIEYLKDKIWLIVGTRPEVIKQAPLALELAADYPGQSALISTGQHQELLMQALEPFGLVVDYVLPLMRSSSDLNELSSKLLHHFGELLIKARPRVVVVQGDTTSGAIAALAAFYAKVPVAHVEAGLRSHDLTQPFPEEANRRVITSVASIHFPPTDMAAQNLINEGVLLEHITVTGNTGIDSLKLALNKSGKAPILSEIKSRKSNFMKMILMTGHRRENEGEAVLNWYSTLRTFLDNNPNYFIVNPTHPNKIALHAIEKTFGNHQRFSIESPLDYVSTCHALKIADIVITDSGGLQEEAVTLGVPTIVCRQKTERMEGVAAGFAKLVNPLDKEALLSALNWAVAFDRTRTHNFENIYGDGLAAKRIVKLFQQKHLL